MAKDQFEAKQWIEDIYFEGKRGEGVFPRGRIDSQTAPDFAATLNEHVRNGNYRLIIDFSEVDFMSTAGLRVITDIQKTCRRLRKGDVVIVDPSRQIYEGLRLAGFLNEGKNHVNVVYTSERKD